MKIDHPSAKTLILGDKNDLKIEELVKISPTFQQIVDKPTRKGKILNIVVTDMWGLYKPCLILPPIEVDDSKKLSGAVSSDHDGVLLHPIVSVTDHKNSSKEITVRRLPESKFNEFGRELTSVNWDSINDEVDP